MTAVRGVYGDAVFDSLYGGIEAVPAHRARSVDNGEVRGSLLGKGAKRAAAKAFGGWLTVLSLFCLCLFLQSVELGDCTLSFLHTRGHANHHMCVVDDAYAGVFTGDSFGIGLPTSCYGGSSSSSSDRDVEVDGSIEVGRPLFPATAPPEFDAMLAGVAVDEVRTVVPPPLLTDDDGNDAISAVNPLFESLLSDCGHESHQAVPLSLWRLRGS